MCNTQRPTVWFLAFAKIYYVVAEIYQRRWLKESGLRLYNVDGTHLVLTSYYNKQQKMSYQLKTCQLHLKVMQHFSSLASFEVNLISYFSLDNFLIGLFQLYGLKKVPQACFLSVIFYFKYYLLPWATFLKGKLIVLSQPILYLKIALAVGQTWYSLVFHLFSLLKAVPKTARLLSPLPTFRGWQQLKIWSARDSTR